MEAPKLSIGGKERENKAENKARKKSVSKGDKKAPKKRPPEVVAALDTMNRMRAEKNLTEYGIGNMVTYHRQHYSTSVSSMVANRSIAAPIWAALHKVIFDDGKEVHFKGRGELESVASDGKSGIRLVDADGETLFCGTPFAPMFLAVSSRGGKKMQIPVAVPKNDAYKVRMTARRFSVVRIVKKTVRGTDKFYVQLTVEGTPEPKLDKYGNDKHVRGKGKVGVYIDTRTVTVAAADGEIIKTYKLNEGIDHFEQEKIRLAQYMSHSRLLNNPDNFDEDGTIKKGVVVDGIRRRLKWHNSNKYYKAKDAKKDLFRVERETRRLERIRIANEILSLGNDIYINEFPFADAAKRKTEDKLKAKAARAEAKRVEATENTEATEKTETAEEATEKPNKPNTPEKPEIQEKPVKADTPKTEKPAKVEKPKVEKPVLTPEQVAEEKAKQKELKQQEKDAKKKYSLREQRAKAVAEQKAKEQKEKEEKEKKSE